MELIINQTLHGYLDGHSLLASSMELSSDTRRIMLSMSDMSGQSMHPKFEDYITGYPIKESGLFALAKTWYAPEMERPGCVYTHTLLINFVDLIKISSLVELTNLFVRPAKNQFSKYKSVLKFTDNISRKGYLNDNYNRLELSNIISSLYSQNDLSTLITSSNSKEYENLCLTIWEQQWPRLKRNFSFCTGAISNRMLNGKGLDLQVIPINSDTNTMKSGILVNEVSKLQVEAKWIDKVVDDLLQPGTLRNFFIEFGSDTNTDRVTLKNLTEVFIAFQENTDEISEIIKKIGTLFQDKTTAVNLKNQLLLSNGQKRFFPSKTEVQIFKELATTDVYEAFNFEKGIVRERLQQLYNESPRIVLNLLNDLLGGNINPLGVYILKEISNLVTEETEDIYNKEHRNLLLIFTKLNPALAYNSKFWQVNIEFQRENFYAICNTDSSQAIEWEKLINAMLLGGAIIPRDVYSIEKGQAIFFVLDWFNKHQEYETQEEWLNPRYFNQSVLLTWLSKQSEVKNLRIIELLIYCLNPNSKEVTKLGAKIWVAICSDKFRFYKDRASHVRLNSFSLALAFHSCDIYSQRLIEQTFENVYLSAMNSQLDYDSWKIIEPHTKPLTFWNDWDKCKKLSIAIVEKYHHCKWDANDINKLFSHKINRR